MENTNTNFAGNNSYPCLYTLGLSDECKNVLEKIYPEIESGKDSIVVMKRTDGVDPYVKVGVKYLNDCKHLFVQMQIASAKSYWTTYYKSTSAVSNTLGSNLYVYSCQEISSNATGRMLNITTNLVSTEIRARVKIWMASEQKESTKDEMIDSLQKLQAQIFRVNYVIQCVIQTYTKNEQDLENLVTEKQHLSNFAYQLADLINLLIPEQEEIPTPLINENSEKQDSKIEETEKKIPPSRRRDDDLNFKTMVEANAWFMRKFKDAIDRSNATEKSTYNNVKHSFNDIVKFYHKDFYVFADNIDAHFNNKRNDNDFKILKTWISEIVKKLIGSIASGDSKQIESLTSEFENVDNFRSLFEKLITRKGGKGEDFQKLFSILVNEEVNGPADKDNAPIVLQKIFNESSFFNLFCPSEKNKHSM